MDRMQDCGSCDRGSIPRESTKVMVKKDNTESLPTKLLLRNKEFLKGKNVLVLNPDSEASFGAIREIFPKKKITAFTPDYGVYRNLTQKFWDKENVKIFFGHFYDPEEKHDLVILHLPKSKDLIEYFLALTSFVSKKDAPVILIGENDAGIKSAGKILEKAVGKISHKDNAFHSSFFLALNQNFSGRFSLENWIKLWTSDIHNLKIASLPGVFSKGEIDPGTKILLENISLPKNASVLDWGCGNGTIGLFLQKKYGCNVDFVDSSAFALEATKITLKENGIDVVRIFPSDIFSDVKGEYDFIVSNPPFHKGIKNFYGATEKFLLEAPARLKLGGKIFIVANSFLKYEPIIEKSFGNFREVLNNKKYKILVATRG